MGFTLFVIFLAILIIALKRVPQGHEAVVERLGRPLCVRKKGVFIAIPFIDRVAAVDCRSQVVKLESVPLVLEDLVPATFTGEIVFSVSDALKARTAIADYREGMRELAESEAKAVARAYSFDALLESRDGFRDRLLRGLKGKATNFGLSVTAVENSVVLPSQEIQDALRRQAEKERAARG